MLLLSAAFAADVLVYAPGGIPAAGDAGEWEFLLIEGGKIVERPFEVRAAGELVALPAPAGRRRYRYTPLPGVPSATFDVRVAGDAPVTRTFALPPAPGPTLSPPPEVEAAVGSSRIELRFPWSGQGLAQGFMARASEGRVIEVRTEAGAVVVAVEPGADRQARVLAVALIDTDDPDGEPAFGLVRLRARPQLSLTTEPGNEVTVRVGRRSYGPFVADAAGTASLVFDALPGETTYEVTVTDDLGNTQRSSGPLPTSPRPVLVGVEAAGPAAGVDVWLAAWTPTGIPWTGAGPACRSGVPTVEEANVTRGVFRRRFAKPTEAVLFDPKVECSLGDATLSLRLPRASPTPTRIDLRVYPEALSADFPIAQVQGALYDERGERLPAGDLVVRAEKGELQLEGAGDVIRGEYRGQAAVEHGGDTLIATWEQAPGEGRPWSIEADVGAVAGPEGDELVVHLRARDRLGRPLPEVLAQVELGGLRLTATTDRRGTATVRFRAVPSLPTLITVVAGEHLGVVVPWLPGEPRPLPDPGRPDLEARVDLPIRAGRVRQVFLDVEPRPLQTGSGAVGAVKIRMLDAAGNPVRDEQVSVVASAGTVDLPVVQPDGSFIARYEPPSILSDETVRITARTTAGEVATDLELTPRPIHGGVGVSVGWIASFGVVSAPTLSLSVYNHIPFLPRIFGLRVGATVYNLETTIHDAGANADIDVHATLIPFDVGLVVTERWGRRSLHAGLAAVIAPYTLAMDFEGDRGISGVDLASPGMAVQAGAGYRLGSSELFAEARFLLFTASSAQLAFEGSVGGASLAAGYRLLY